MISDHSTSTELSSKRYLRPRDSVPRVEEVAHHAVAALAEASGGAVRAGGRRRLRYHMDLGMSVVHYYAVSKQDNGAASLIVRMGVRKYVCVCGGMDGT